MLFAYSKIRGNSRFLSKIYTIVASSTFYSMLLTRREILGWFSIESFKAKFWISFWYASSIFEGNIYFSVQYFAISSLKLNRYSRFIFFSGIAAPGYWAIILLFFSIYLTNFKTYSLLVLDSINRRSFFLSYSTIFLVSMISILPKSYYYDAELSPIASHDCKGLLPLSLFWFIFKLKNLYPESFYIGISF